MSKMFKKRNLIYGSGVVIQLKDNESRKSFSDMTIYENITIYGNVRFYKDVIDYSFKLGTVNDNNKIIGYFKCIGNEIPRGFDYALKGSPVSFKLEKRSDDRIEIFAGFDSYSEVLTFFDELNVFSTNKLIIVHHKEG